MSAPISAPEIFAWGSAAGATVAVVLFVIPELLHAHFTRTQVEWTTQNVITIVVLVVLFSLVAGLITLAPNGVDTRNKAIQTGLGIQAVVRGILGAGQQIVREPHPTPRHGEGAP